MSICLRGIFMVNKSASIPDETIKLILYIIILAILGMAVAAIFGLFG